MLPLTPEPRLVHFGFSISDFGLKTKTANSRKMAFNPKSELKKPKWQQSVGESNPRFRFEGPASSPLDERTFYAVPHAVREGYYENKKSRGLITTPGQAKSHLEPCGGLCAIQTKIEHFGITEAFAFQGFA